MSRDFALVDVVLRNALLEATHGSNGVECTRMHFAATVGDDAHYDLLPPVFSPCSRLHARAEVADVLHDTVHCARKVDFVLVVHGDADEELRLALGAHVLAQLVSAVHVVVWIAGDGRVSHVGELDVVSSREETVQNGGDLALEDQLAVDQADLLLGHDSLAGSSARHGTGGSGPVVLVLVVYVCVAVGVCVVGHVGTPRLKVGAAVVRLVVVEGVVVDGYGGYVAHVSSHGRVAGHGSGTASKQWLGRQWPRRTARSRVAVYRLRLVLCGRGRSGVVERGARGRVGAVRRQWPAVWVVWRRRAVGGRRHVGRRVQHRLGAREARHARGGRVVCARGGLGWSAEGLHW